MYLCYLYIYLLLWSSGHMIEPLNIFNDFFSYLIRPKWNLWVYMLLHFSRGIFLAKSWVLLKQGRLWLAGIILKYSCKYQQVSQTSLRSEFWLECLIPKQHRPSRKQPAFADTIVGKNSYLSLSTQCLVLRVENYLSSIFRWPSLI